MHALSLYIDLHEHSVLWFIFFRTRLYGKEWEAISLRHFKFGMATNDGRFIAAPLDMGENKILECLRHLEGKGMIEVRRSIEGGNQPNVYRIKPASECSREHIMAYISRHQRKLHQSALSKFAKSRGIQQLLRAPGMPPVGILEMVDTLPLVEGDGTLQTEVGVPSDRMHLNNNQNIKDQTSNIAPAAREVAGIKIRKLNLRKP